MCAVCGASGTQSGEGAAGPPKKSKFKKIKFCRHAYMKCLM